MVSVSGETVGLGIAEKTAGKTSIRYSRRSPQERVSVSDNENRRNQDADAGLSGPPRDNARRPAGPRGNAALFWTQVRQCREPDPSLRMGNGKGSGAGPATGGLADRGRTARDRLHQRRDRIEQPGVEGRDGSRRKPWQSHRDDGDRTPGGA